MTNEMIFKEFASSNFVLVQDFLNKGYTETAEFMAVLNSLYNDIGAALMDMEAQNGLKYCS